jgi:hypothetical protein
MRILAAKVPEPLWILQYGAWRRSVFAFSSEGMKQEGQEFELTV